MDFNLSKEQEMVRDLCRVFAKTGKRCADKGVQIHGGYGLMDEYPISRYWREVKFEEILEGTSEIQRLNIARRVLKLLKGISISC